jgi:hypothetical protein
VPLGAVLGVDERVWWGVVAIVLAIGLGRALKLMGARLEQRRPSEERELMQLRNRETLIVLVATAIPYATAIVVLIVLASFFLPAAALGGSAFIAVVVGFAAQPRRSDRVHARRRDVVAVRAPPVDQVGGTER